MLQGYCYLVFLRPYYRQLHHFREDKIPMKEIMDDFGAATQDIVVSILFVILAGSILFSGVLGSSISIIANSIC